MSMKRSDMKITLALWLGLFVWTGVWAATPPTWSVNAPSFSYGMGYVVRARFEGLPVGTGAHQLGVFVNDTCRGVARPISVGGMALYYLDVYSNTVSGDTLVFKFYHGDLDSIYTSPKREYFVRNGQTGSAAQPYDVLFAYSNDYPVEIDSVPPIAAPIGMPFAPVDMKRFLSRIDNDPLEWTVTGDEYVAAAIDSLGVLRVSRRSDSWSGTGQVAVRVLERGVRRHRAEIEIPCISRPYDTLAFRPLPVQAAGPGQAFRAFRLADYISPYDTCNPYRVRQVAPVGTDAPPAWTVAAVGAGGSMSVIAKVRYDQTPLYHPDSRLWAYVDGVPRGVAAPLFSGGSYWYFLTIEAGTAGRVVFRFYDGENRVLHREIAGPFFVPNGRVGQVTSPYDLDIAPLVVTLSPDDVLTASAKEPSWRGSQTLQIIATSCEYPDFDQDTTYATYKLEDAPIRKPGFFSPNSINFVEGSCRPLYNADAFDAQDSEGSGLRYSILPGTDGARFSIQPDSGQLAWTTAPDFENPGDANRDNQYEVGILVTDSEGLSDTLRLLVRVSDAFPEVHTASISGNAFICDAGGTALLRVSSGVGYQWNTGASTTELRVSTPGVYRVTVTDSRACRATAEYTVSRVTLDLPADTAILWTGGGGGALRGGFPSGGQYSGPGVSAGRFSPSLTGAGLFPIVYTLSDSSGCTAVAIDTLKVAVPNSVSTPASSPTVCANTQLASQFFWTRGATGIGTASGLPQGVSATWANDTIRVTGTPTVPGTYEYTIPLAGGFGGGVAQGRLTVAQPLSASAVAQQEALCKSSEWGSEIHLTSGATSLGRVTGLPAGLTAQLSDQVVRVSGVPQDTGQYHYQIPLRGTCGNYRTAETALAGLAAPGAMALLASGGVASRPLSIGDLNDGGWRGIPLPFPFTYFGQTIDTVDISTNGFVQFKARDGGSGLLRASGFGALPNRTQPFNSISILAMDHDLRAGGMAAYWTEGTAPTRRFVIRFDEVATYGLPGTSTFQMVLREEDGVVESQIIKATAPLRKVVGLNGPEGIDGATGFNATVKMESPRTYRFDPFAIQGTLRVGSRPLAQIGASEASGIPDDGVLCEGGLVTLHAEGAYSYRWENGAVEANRTVSVSAPRLYTLTAFDALGCSSSAEIQIDFSTPMQLNVETTESCFESAGGGTLNLLVAGGTPEYSFRWSNGATEARLTNLSAGQFMVTVTDKYGCTAQRSATLLKATAQASLSLTAPEAVCAGSAAALSLQASEAMRLEYAVGNGQRQTLNLFRGPNNLPLGALSQNTAFKIISLTTLSGGCAAKPNREEWNIEALQSPSLGADNILVCSGSEFELALRSTAPGSFYDWNADYGTLQGGQGGALGVSFGKSPLLERLENPTAGDVSATYRFRPYAQKGTLRCTGEAISIQVTVRPKVALVPVPPQQVCSGTPLEVALQTTPYAATVNWTRREGNGSLLSGSGDISEVLRNTSNTAQTVQYEVEIAGVGCASNKETISVRVLPSPRLSLQESLNICSGTANLRAGSVTAGSTPGLTYTYWQDRNLSVPLGNPAAVLPGLYFIRGENAEGCSTLGSIRVEGGVRFRAQIPAPRCLGDRVDLTKLTVNATPGQALKLSYWQDSLATQAVINPASVGNGRYFIKATQAQDTAGCFAIQPIPVVEQAPSLLNGLAALQVCSGSAFSLSPKSSLPGMEFEWTRSPIVGVREEGTSGTGDILEVLSLNDPTVVRVRYAYRLKVPGCGLRGMDAGSFEVAVTPNPIAGIVDTLSTCNPSVDLTLLPALQPALRLRYAYDQNGQELLPNPKRVLPGRYFIVAEDALGCRSAEPIEVRSRLLTNRILSDTLEVCPPGKADLELYADSSGLNRFFVSYYANLDSTLAIRTPSAVDTGLYYLFLEDKARTCRSVLPISVRSGLPALVSPQDVVGHCGGTPLRYTPRGNSRSASFAWSLVSRFPGDTLNASGEGEIAMMLGNNSDTAQTARFRIVASSAVCPQSRPSYLLKVNVLPELELLPAVGPDTIVSGDSLLLDVRLARNVRGARLNWEADYRGVSGGIGKLAGAAFGPGAVAERLFNLSDSTIRMRYLLTPVLGSTCSAPASTVWLSVRSDFAVPPASVAGFIGTESNIAVEGVEMSLSGLVGTSTLGTGSNGQFYFGELRGGYDYTLRPYLNSNLMNGVSTRDVLILQQHILGKKSLETPYKLIAADVNNSSSVTIADLLSLRKVILGYETRFPNNTSWRFVASDYRFANPQSPWTAPFPELRNFNDMAGKWTADFTGIKIGDLNADVVANRSGGLAPRSGQMLSMELENAAAQVGDRLLLPLRIGGRESADGLQFTFLYDQRALRLAPDECVLPRPELIGLFPESGMLTASWDRALAPGDTLLWIAFDVLREGRLNEWVSLSDRIAAPEAYIAEETRPLELRFTDGSQPAGGRARAMQNYPNPFLGQTELPFWLPEADKVWLRVYDLGGRLVLEQEGAFGRGHHAFEVKADMLPGGNTWYYQIGGRNWVETRQMLRF